MWKNAAVYFDPELSGGKGLIAELIQPRWAIRLSSGRPQDRQPPRIIKVNKLSCDRHNEDEIFVTVKAVAIKQDDLIRKIPTTTSNHHW
jgi:hypothetical protein